MGGPSYTKKPTEHGRGRGLIHQQQRTRTEQSDLNRPLGFRVQGGSRALALVKELNPSYHNRVFGYIIGFPYYGNIN